ncbi:MAG: hemin uptake protein HemP [Rudaea sp.]
MHAISTAPERVGDNTTVRSPGMRVAADAPISFDSGRLFNGAQVVRINHGDQEYRLRQTRNGKLILTK